jgi:hypothetical protein
MDIHAPERPIHSLKDFGVHIAVVTVGILIALSLEGLRETIHDHHLVVETREHVRQEMGHDREQADLEYKRVSLYHEQLKRIVEGIPALEEQHPDQVTAQLDTIHNPGYILSAESWTAALSTGVLAHMPTEEVSSYAYAAGAIKKYSDLQHDARIQQVRTKAYFTSHPTMNAGEIAEATERLIIFYDAEETLAFYCLQMEHDIDIALKNARG